MTGSRSGASLGAPGHKRSTAARSDVSVPNSIERSATVMGVSARAAGHRSSSPYHHSNLARDKGEVMTWKLTPASSQHASRLARKWPR
jgi:hypothetical protein